MYVEIFLADFAVFRGSATVRNIRSPAWLTRAQVWFLKIFSFEGDF